MVLLAAAVCTKSGKVIISRQFVDMNKPRIEGILAAFPKLIGSGKQHTFVETESVRYVYQPMDKLYVLLITTKASNILEDLETLRLFSKVIPEYCKSMDETNVVDNAFSLIFAFDEIVALGYRENVNLSQIRTFTEMDSHEERVFQAVRQNQEREANENSKRKARELTLAKKDAAKKGIKYPMTAGGISPASIIDQPTTVTSFNDNHKMPKTQYSKIPISNKAMKLGGKQKELEHFVDKLISEGEEVTSLPNMMHNLKVATPAVDMEDVSVLVEEKLSLCLNKDGGVQQFEVHGILMLRISNDKYSRIKLFIENNQDSLPSPVQLQCHPNVDKKLFATNSQIALKDSAKPFPLNMDVGVVKWHFSSQDDSLIPLNVTCWPTESENGCEINVEYVLVKDDMELRNVSIQIPLPSNTHNMVVVECGKGDYVHNKSKTILTWNIPLIDGHNKNGTIEFTTDTGTSNDFFPVKVDFVACKTFFDIQVSDIVRIDTEEDTPVKFSTNTQLIVDKYDIV